MDHQGSNYCKFIQSEAKRHADQFKAKEPIDKEDTKKVEFAGGATSSYCPDFTMIPYEALEAYAERCMLGAAKHGRNNWRKAIAPNQTFRELTPQENYILNRINHTIRHLWALANQIQEFNLISTDSPQENIGALMWNSGFLAVACKEVLEKRKEV